MSATLKVMRYDLEWRCILKKMFAYVMLQIKSELIPWQQNVDTQNLTCEIGRFLLCLG